MEFVFEVKFKIGESVFNVRLYASICAYIWTIKIAPFRALGYFIIKQTHGNDDKIAIYEVIIP